MDSKQKPPASIRRARTARIATILMGLAGVAFVLYRIIKTFTH